MALKDIFIANLRKFRRQKKISQMELAEKCNTAASYIGEIEIGRKFPSIDMIENIAEAIGIDAHRFFMDDSLLQEKNKKAAAYFTSLSPEFQMELISSIMDLISKGLIKAIKPDDDSGTV